ncbi:MAG: hypothetical protein LBT89_10440 [Planctomycetaceae bacterium]|nr:hypothetical protein [Planctomycetaceae bacterium]
MCCKLRKSRQGAGGQSYPPETAAWLAGISDELHEKLVKAGLINDKQRRTLGQFIETFKAGGSGKKERLRLSERQRKI